MKLYMVRHGQSEANQQQVYSGWAQVKLTQQGEDDARRAGEYLAGKHFDRIYSSDLIRAVTTAKLAIPGCEPEKLQELREISVGRLAGHDVLDRQGLFGEDLQANRAKLDFTPYDGENRAMLDERVRAFMKRMEQSTEETVIACSHLGVLQSMADMVLGLNGDRSHLRCRNCCIALFAYENGRWYLEGWGLGE